jgi:hypothetical protein
MASVGQLYPTSQVRKINFSVQVQEFGNGPTGWDLAASIDVLNGKGSFYCPDLCHTADPSVQVLPMG